MFRITCAIALGCVMALATTADASRFGGGGRSGGGRSGGFRSAGFRPGGFHSGGFRPGGLRPHGGVRAPYRYRPAPRVTPTRTGRGRVTRPGTRRPGTSRPGTMRPGTRRPGRPTMGRVSGRFRPSFYGRGYRGWGRKFFWGRHRTWTFWCGRARCWYYWHGMRGQFLPVDMIDQAPPPMGYQPPMQNVPMQAPPGGNPLNDSQE